MRRIIFIRAQIKITFLLIILFSAFFLSANQYNPALGAQKDVTLEGFFFLGFEQKDLRILDSDEIFWIDEIPDSLGFLYTDLTSKITDIDLRYAVYVKIKADVSDIGYHGHFGGYKREISLKEILEIRMPTKEEKKLRNLEKK